MKFGQREVTTKDFYGQKQIIDIFKIDINKVAVSDKVPCNNGNDCCYIVGYQLDDALIPLLKYDKNSAYTMSFNVSEEQEWVPRYKTI